MWYVTMEQDLFKMREMCLKAFDKSHLSFVYIPDWCIIQEMIETVGGCCYHCDDEFRE